MRGRASIGFVLSDKKLGNEDVVGLSDFWVNPTKQGLGRRTLAMIEVLGEDKVVVAFADPTQVEFFEKCEWFIGPMVDGKYLVASESVNVKGFGGEIW